MVISRFFSEFIKPYSSSAWAVITYVPLVFQECDIVTFIPDVKTNW